MNSLLILNWEMYMMVFDVFIGGGGVEFVMAK